MYTVIFCVAMQYNKIIKLIKVNVQVHAQPNTFDNYILSLSHLLLYITIYIMFISSPIRQVGIINNYHIHLLFLFIVCEWTSVVPCGASS